MAELRRPKVRGMSPELAVGVIAFSDLVAPVLGTDRFGFLLFIAAATGLGILIAGIVRWVRETVLNRRRDDYASADQ